MLRWCGPSWPTRTKPSSKSIGWNSAKLPPMSRRSMIIMAMQVLRSDSPHMGKPAAVSSELPTIRLVTSFAASGCPLRPRSSRPARPGRCSSTNGRAPRRRGRPTWRSSAVSFAVIGSDFGVGRVEQVEDLPLLGCDLVVRDGASQCRSRSSASVCTTWQPKAAVRAVWSVCMSSMCSMRMPELADPGALQVVQHPGDAAPFGDLRVGRGVVLERAEDHAAGGLLPMRMATPVNSGTEQKSSLQSCM